MSVENYTARYIAGLHGDPMWEAIWEAIQVWDIERGPGEGVAGATGSDVTHIYDAIVAKVGPRKQVPVPDALKKVKRVVDVSL